MGGQISCNSKKIKKEKQLSNLRNDLSVTKEVFRGDNLMKKEVNISNSHITSSSESCTIKEWENYERKQNFQFIKKSNICDKVKSEPILKFANDILKEMMSLKLTKINNANIFQPLCSNAILEVFQENEESGSFKMPSNKQAEIKMINSLTIIEKLDYFLPINNFNNFYSLFNKTYSPQKNSIIKILSPKESILSINNFITNSKIIKDSGSMMSNVWRKSTYSNCIETERTGIPSITPVSRINTTKSSRDLTYAGLFESSNALFRHKKTKSSNSIKYKQDDNYFYQSPLVKPGLNEIQEFDFDNLDCELDTKTKSKSKSNTPINTQHIFLSEFISKKIIHNMSPKVKRKFYSMRVRAHCLKIRKRKEVKNSFEKENCSLIKFFKDNINTVTGVCKQKFTIDMRSFKKKKSYRQAAVRKNQVMKPFIVDTQKCSNNFREAVDKYLTIDTKYSTFKSFHTRNNQHKVKQSRNFKNEEFKDNLDNFNLFNSKETKESSKEINLSNISINEKGNKKFKQQSDKIKVIRQDIINMSPFTRQARRFKTLKESLRFLKI
jgi:hypothetical protein